MSSRMADRPGVGMTKDTGGPSDRPIGVFAAFAISFAAIFAILVTQVYPTLDNSTRVRLLTAELSVAMYPVGVAMLLWPGEFAFPNPRLKRASPRPAFVRIFGAFLLVVPTGLWLFFP